MEEYKSQQNQLKVIIRYYTASEAASVRNIINIIEKMFAITTTKSHLKMFKMFLEFIRKCNKSDKTNKNLVSTFDCSTEIADNLANEALMAEIIFESQQVCYLKTEAGEFFWNYHEENIADADLMHS